EALPISGNFNLTTDDIVISVFQPKARFITTVFEPQPKLPDSLTYDITAWNLFYAYNVQAYATTERLNVAKPYQKRSLQREATLKNPYAYLFRYESVDDAVLLAKLMNAGIKVRAAEKTFSIDGETFKGGSLIVTRRNNENIQALDRKSVV